MELDYLLKEISSIEDEIMFQAGKEITQGELKNIKAVLEGDDEQREDLLSNYIVHDYKVDGKRLIEKYFDLASLKEFSVELKNSYKNSYLSVFEVKNGSRKIVTDIFSRKDFEIEFDKELDDGNIIVGRLFNFGYKFIGPNYMVYGPEYKKVIYAGIFVKFKEFEAKKKKSGDDSLGDIFKFIKSKPEIIMRYLSIINSTEENELWEGEEMDVYVAKYVFSKKKEVLKMLIETNNISVLDHEDDFTVLSLFNSDKYNVAELVILENIIEIEARSIEELELAKVQMESILSGLVHFAGQDLVSIENLI